MSDTGPPISLAQREKHPVVRSERSKWFGVEHEFFHIAKIDNPTSIEIDRVARPKLRIEWHSPGNLPTLASVLVSRLTQQSQRDVEVGLRGDVPGVSKAQAYC